jgi:uncharacterized protein (DUF924 family)
MTPENTASPEEVLEFWFGSPTDAAAGQPRKAWFVKDAAFDRTCLERFGTTHAAAAAHRLDSWQERPAGALALTIVLDQLSRNIYRGTAQAFAQDAQALTVAAHAIARGLDAVLPPLQRMFLYLPYEHSEEAAMQARSVELFENLRGHPYLDEAIDYAHRHRAVIERFGRFPHRNELLGRPSSAEELAYLRTPGSGF